MSDVGEADIERYFELYGWSFERLEEGTFRTGFQANQGAFAALVRVTEHWVVFTINPFLSPSGGGFGPATLKALAHANHALHMAKIGIDEDGDAFLTVELPSEGFTYSHFADALTAMAHFADGFLVPLLQAQAIDERSVV